MKTQEELNVIKSEVDKLNAKLEELTEDELKEVTGGAQECDEYLSAKRSAKSSLYPHFEDSLNAVKAGRAVASVVSTLIDHGESTDHPDSLITEVR